MVSLFSLWLPVLLSAVAVFMASSVVHMVLKYHKTDYRSFDDEDGVANALRPFHLAPGNYMMPNMADCDPKDPQFRERMERGPCALITVTPNGMPNMGKFFVQWFGYCLLVALLVAYVAGRTLAPGAATLEVFRLVATVAFIGFALGSIPESIWFHRRWAATARFAFDGLLYALATAAIFAWLWPGA
jgi:hypothetical protein